MTFLSATNCKNISSENVRDYFSFVAESFRWCFSKEIYSCLQRNTEILRTVWLSRKHILPKIIVRCPWLSSRSQEIGWKLFTTSKYISNRWFAPTQVKMLQCAIAGGGTKEANEKSFVFVHQQVVDDVTWNHLCNYLHLSFHVYITKTNLLSLFNYADLNEEFFSRWSTTASIALNKTLPQNITLHKPNSFAIFPSCVVRRTMWLPPPPPGGSLFPLKISLCSPVPEITPKLVLSFLVPKVIYFLLRFFAFVSHSPIQICHVPLFPKTPRSASLSANYPKTKFIPVHVVS